MNILLGEIHTVGDLRKIIEPFQDDLPVSIHASRYATARFRGDFPDYVITIVGQDFPPERGGDG